MRLFLSQFYLKHEKIRFKVDHNVKILSNQDQPTLKDFIYNEEVKWARTLENERRFGKSIV